MNPLAFLGGPNLIEGLGPRDGGSFGSAGVHGGTEGMFCCLQTSGGGKEMVAIGKAGRGAASRIRDCHAVLNYTPSQQRCGGSNQVTRGGHQGGTTQARVYSLTPGDVENAKNVVTGMISFMSLNAIVMFDSGATHSFVSRRFAKVCGIDAQLLRVELGVAMPAGSVIVCSKVVKDHPIEIQGRKLSASLIVLEMQGFNIILGMDWLASSYASIECRKKEVVFGPPGEEEFNL
ncbi:uncharacterized protein LOC131156066 [Malania oleifera]|uniref:uncharacterized protein LOC131156066 n=1 Tax=Malania oleifera TaxID=397392 RepID=UPI0025ADAF27|nr:uncharacterized protein LOC131156066 [Malania oleifera]